MEEKTFFEYEDVKVTNARFVVGSQTFALGNITSVQAFAQEPNRTGPAVLIVVGIVVSLAGNAILGIPVCIGGVAWLILQKPNKFHVRLRTASGETTALTSHQRDYIDKVVKALNEAIVARAS